MAVKPIFTFRTLVAVASAVAKAPAVASTLTTEMCLQHVCFTATIPVRGTEKYLQGDDDDTFCT